MTTQTGVLHVPELSCAQVSKYQSALGITSCGISIPQPLIRDPKKFYQPYDIATDLLLTEKPNHLVFDCHVVPMFDAEGVQLNLTKGVAEFLKVHFVNQTGIATLANGGLVQTTPPFFWVNKSGDPTYVYPSYMQELFEDDLFAEWIGAKHPISKAVFVGAVHTLTNCIIQSGSL
jgi:hypothetical protein